MPEVKEEVSVQTCPCGKNGYHKFVRCHVSHEAAPKQTHPAVKLSRGLVMLHQGEIYCANCYLKRSALMNE
jgi:hypothetical protein